MSVMFDAAKYLNNFIIHVFTLSKSDVALIYLLLVTTDVLAVYCATTTGCLVFISYVMAKNAMWDSNRGTLAVSLLIRNCLRLLYSAR